MTTVLVTRPRHLAGPLIDKLRAKGFEVLHEPMLTIVPKREIRPQIQKRGVTMITSRTTLAMLQDRADEVADLLKRPCYCVGEQTALAAAAFGFEQIRTGSGDGETLAHMILEGEKRSAEVLHIGGVDVVPQAQAVLREAGQPLVHWPVYQAVERSEMSKPVAQAMRTGKIDAALFFSVRTAQTFVQMVLTQGLETCCTRMVALGLSPAVEVALAPLPWQRILVPPHPSEERALTCLFEALTS